MIIKSYFKGSPRRFTQESPLFERIEENIRQIYKLSSEENIKLYYKDDDEEWVCLLNDEDVSHASSITGGKMIRIKVVSNESPEDIFLRNPENREAVCSMTKELIDSSEFDKIAEKILPKIIASLQDSGMAPKIDFEFKEKNESIIKNSNHKVDSKDTNSMLSSIRRDMEKLDMIGVDKELIDSIEECKANEDDDDSFVIVEASDSMSESRGTPSIYDSLRDLGFYDTQKNQKVIEKYGQDVNRVIDALLQDDC